MARKINLVRNEVDPEPTEVIAKSIIDIAAAMKTINEGRLSRRAICLLIRDRTTGLGLNDIDAVLTAITDLKRIYTKNL